MTPLLLGILLAIQGAATGSQAARPLSEVHSIYVASMGHDDEAVGFRGSLKQELAHAGFALEDDSAKADALLSGTFSVRVEAGYTRAHADVAPRAPGGAMIWQGSFGQRFLPGRRGDADVKNRAGDIADKLRKDFKQSSAHR
jgi:hypothetical protein